MGEKRTVIVVGAYRDECGPCPDQDGWVEWAYKRPEFTKAARGYGVVLDGQEFLSSYESSPAWLGFEVTMLEYGDTFSDDDESDMDLPAGAWDRLREIAREAGAELPAGKMIVAHDGV